ncbi:MAG: DUF3460 family protein [Burkholderiales bacterium]
MSFFRRPDYTSDTTQFIEKLRADRPGLEERQRAGRALLWDKNVDIDAWKSWRKDRVPQKPYVYQTDNPRPTIENPPAPKP